MVKILLMPKHSFLLLALFFLVLPAVNSQNAEKLRTGDLFPVIKGELLSYKKITLPEHCKGKVSVLVIAFKRATQTQVDTWTKPLLQEFNTQDDFRFIEVPMISNFYSWVSNYIDNGMRSGIIESMHKNVMTYYGPLGSYFKYFEVENKKLCYLFLLDKEGKVQFITKGESNPEDLEILLQKTKELLDN